MWKLSSPLTQEGLTTRSLYVMIGEVAPKRRRTR